MSRTSATSGTSHGQTKNKTPFQEIFTSSLTLIARTRSRSQYLDEPDRDGGYRSIRVREVRCSRQSKDPAVDHSCYAAMDRAKQPQLPKGPRRRLVSGCSLEQWDCRVQGHLGRASAGLRPAHGRPTGARRPCSCVVDRGFMRLSSASRPTYGWELRDRRYRSCYLDGCL